MSGDLDRMKNGWRPMDSCPPGPVLVWTRMDRVKVLTVVGTALEGSLRCVAWHPLPPGPWGAS